MNPAAWRVTLAATALMALVMGARSAFGLFVSPLNTATGLGLAGISLAAAVAQLGLGAGQPLVGWLAERHGALRVIRAGALLLAVATAAIAWAGSVAMLTALLLAVALAGSATGSNALLIGELGRRLTPAQQGLAVGLVGAGGSAGQLLLAPATQWGITQHGWFWALMGTAAISLLAWPLAGAFRHAPPRAAGSSSTPVADALRNRRFWAVTGAFTICGFHVGFLTMHLPGAVERCGLPSTLAGPALALMGAANIAGSLAVGWALKRHDAAALLALLYLLRAASVAALLAMPATSWAMLGFALLAGATYMAVLPPTAQRIAQDFGAQRLGTLFGIVMVLHQVGGFAGVWLGGWLANRHGSDTAFWALDLALALLAAVLVWPRSSACAARQRLAQAAG
jgi:predicted MFS family arabinose efflux permease